MIAKEDPPPDLAESGNGLGEVCGDGKHRTHIVPPGRTPPLKVFADFEAFMRRAFADRKRGDMSE